MPRSCRISHDLLIFQAAVITKLLSSCQGCRQEGGPVGILEERRQGLQVNIGSLALRFDVIVFSTPFCCPH